MKRAAILTSSLAALLGLVVSCTPSVRVTWKERLAGQVPSDIKAVQILDFKSQVKHEAGVSTGRAVDDATYGKTVATNLSERIQQAGQFKVIPGDADLKKFLDSRDVMDALVNEGVMKPDVRDKLQKIPGLDAIIVGEVSCSTRKDENPIHFRGTSFKLQTISATATVNFRMYSVKTGNCILSKPVTKSKSGIGAQAADQALMPLINQCVDEFAMDLLGGEVERTAKMFAGKEETELKSIIEPLDAGVDPLRVADQLEAYAKAHPDSAAALYDLGVIAYIKGDKQTAAKLIEDAILKAGSEAKTFKQAYDEMLAGKRGKRR